MNKSHYQAGGEVPPQENNPENTISLEDFLKLPLSSKLLETRGILEPGCPGSRSLPPLYPLPSLDIVVDPQHNRNMSKTEGYRDTEPCLDSHDEEREEAQSG
jgi:hypothetical protein